MPADTAVMEAALDHDGGYVANSQHFLATCLLVGAVANAQATWLIAEMEAKARLPAAVGVGRVTVSKLGLHIDVLIGVAMGK